VKKQAAEILIVDMDSQPFIWCVKEGIYFYPYQFRVSTAMDLRHMKDPGFTVRNTHAQ
jgi:hypothetical protein